MAEVKSDMRLAAMDIDSHPLLSNCNEESPVDPSNLTNDDVELTLVNATTTAFSKVESTSDIADCIETSESQGLFRMKIMIKI